MSGSYLGSQAFTNIITSQNESVNPNTGTPYFAASLANLRGVRPSIDLKLQLLYLPGAPRIFGLPANWALNLPYILHGRSLTMGGRTYAIDFGWIDDKEHASGLRYVNNHGIKFERVSPPLPLPSNMPGSYAYQLQHADGSCDYFDEMGKPLEHRDIYGNYIYYSFTGALDGGVDSDDVFLEYIQDSWGQQVKIGRMPGYEMLVTLPDQSETSVIFSTTGIASITDACKNTINFEYVSLGGQQQVLSTITYPQGLVSRFDYRQIEFLAPDGSVRSMPAVQDHYYMDAEMKIHRRTNYDYGGISSQTYTGAAIGVRMGGLVDGLMEGQGKALQYKYDVTQTSFDENDQKMAMTRTWFNYLHVPVEEIKFVMNSDNAFAEALQTAFTYRVDTGTRARNTNYNRPYIIETFRNTAPKNGLSYEPLTRSTVEYNEYGSPTLATEELYVSNSGYVKQLTSSSEYMKKPEWRTQVKTKAVIIDEVARTKFQEDNTPTEDGRAISTTLINYGDAGSGSQLQLWKERSFLYDPNGRIISETYAWCPGVKVPDGSAASSTTRTTYSCENGIYTQVDTDPYGNSTTSQYDVRKSSGPIICKILPAGQKETFEYDNIGRLTRHTDALGHLTTTDHFIGPRGRSEKVTTPLQYINITKYDVLDRVVETADNGDPTKPATSEPLRILSQTSYDCRSRRTQSIDALGLTTIYTYDALDRPLTVTDPRRNVTTYEYNEAQLTVTQRLNGDLRSVAYLNGRSEQMRLIQYPDSGDVLTSSILEEYVYDGSRKVIAKTISRIPKKSDTSSASVIKKETTQYGPESCVLSKTTSGVGENGWDTITRKFTLDLFGNAYTYTKQTSYSDGRNFEHQGAIAIHDKNNRLVISRNQLGQEERCSYNPNGWLQTITRLDGTEVRYRHDDMGHTIQSLYPSSTTDFEFNAEGRLSQIRQGQDTIKYQSAVDGTLLSVTYDNNLKQVYSLDQYSRVAEEQDVFGVVKKTTFNEFGEVASRSCKTDTVQYTYGRVNNENGRYIGCSIAGALSYQKSMLYDGFGKPRQVVVKDAASKTLLDTTYLFDNTGKVKSIESASTTSQDHNYKRIFTYDGMGQVVTDAYQSTEPSTTHYTYDGNFNVISTNVNGKVTNMSYNTIDQRVDAGFQYDTNGRMITDDNGYLYTFDDKDRLLSVEVPSQTTSQFVYHADDFLAESRYGSEGAKLYYNNGKVNAMHVTSSDSQRSGQTSFLSQPGSLIASYTNYQPSEYFLNQLGSTAMVMSADKHVSTNYSAYGAKNTPATANSLPAFGFAQEFSDQNSSLIYLRSRFYHPGHMSFISMDTYRVENRYAYCEGDPVNHLDPSGHDWKHWLALGAAVVVGAAIGFGIGGAMVAAGYGVTTAAITAGTIAGGLGAVAGSGTSAWLNGSHYGWEQGFTDLLVGAAAGAASAAVGGYVGATGGALRTMLLAPTLGGATNSLTQMALRNLIANKPITSEQIGLSLLEGAIIGAASGAMTAVARNIRLRRLQAELNAERGISTQSSTPRVSFRAQENRAQPVIVDNHDLPFPNRPPQNSFVRGLLDQSLSSDSYASVGNLHYEGSPIEFSPMLQYRYDV